MRNIGIDFGTCNLKGAERKKNGDITYVKLGKSIDKSRIPNVILYEKTEDGIVTCIGDAASKKPKPEQDKIRSIKSYLQEKEWKREFSFGGNVTAYQATADIMSALYTEIHNSNKTEEVAATITVPVNFSKRQRLMVENAATSAGFIVNATITEPFAAIFYLLLNDGFDEEEDHDTLVFDFGGGTLDLCLVSVTHPEGKTKIETKATIGITFGGNDINKLILERIVRVHAKEEIKKAIDNEENILHRAVNEYFIMEAINDLKAEMFEDDEIEETEEQSLLVKLYDGSVVNLGEIKAEDVYKLFDEDNLDKRILCLLSKLFDDCELTPDEITDVFMIGGTSSIPYFRKLLLDFFEKNQNQNADSIFKLNDDLDRDERIYSAVSKGSVVYSELVDNENVLIEDKIPFLVYSKNAKDEKQTKVDISSRCSSPYASLDDLMRQKGMIAIYQTIYGEAEKEVYLGDIEIDDEIKEYATLYKLAMDEKGNIVAIFAYMLDEDDIPRDEWKKELQIDL